VPMGAAVAEGLKAYLLERRLGVPVSEGVSSIAIKKALLAVSQAAFLATSVVAGYGILSSTSIDVVGRPALPWLILVVATALAVVGGLMLASLRHGKLTARFHALLLALPLVPSRLHAWLEHRSQGFQDVDRHFSPLVGERRRLVAAGAVFYVGWL